MSDLISRQTAIDEVSGLIEEQRFYDIIGKLESLPSAQERKTGRWIHGECNQCGSHAPFWPMASTYYQSDFCPSCGAKMEVEHE